MMKGIIQKLLCIATICVACIPVASARNESVGDKTARAAGEKGISQKDAEKIAKAAFGDDIRTERLALQQAADYSKCAHDDYARHFYRSAAGKKYLKTLARLAKSERKSVHKREQAKLGRLLPKLDKQMDQAENRCMKKLNLEVARGKVFGRSRRPSHS